MATKLPKNLNQPPKYTRLSMPGALPVSDAGLSDRIVPNGGDYGGGLIKGVAVLCRGEALGHGLWCDGEMLSQGAAAINTGDGMKSRFTHPGMSSDGLAKFLGRSKNGVVDGVKLVADKHLASSAHDTPDGDLAGYVMKRAKEDPASFGTSIVFQRDPKAENEFMLSNGGEWDEDEDGYRFIKGFKSPDPENVNNLPHARIGELRAVDFVDDPAANPDGLFHRGDEIAREASELAAFALKLPGAERPALSSFDMDPDRLALFVGRFLNQHGLEIVPKQKEPAMSKTIEAPAAGTATAELSATIEAPNTPLRTGKDFLKKFGQQGAVWFAEGKTWAQAQALHRKELEKRATDAEAKVEELSKALQGFAGGEKTPVSFNGEQSPQEAKESLAQAKFKNKLSPGLARFAAAIVMPRMPQALNGQANRN